MRFIRKSLNNSPYKFIHKTFKSSNQTKVSWKNYRDKGALLRELINEQFGLCAYSEIELNKLNKDSYDAHIEHVKPKVKCPERIFDYFNIVASALHSNSLKKITTPECFAGHAKGGKYDQNLFLSPLARSSAKYFIYLSDGRVVPSNNLDDDGVKMAKYTINCLVPQSYGVSLPQLQETNLWEVYYTLMPRLRQEFDKKYKTLQRQSLY